MSFPKPQLSFWQIINMNVGFFGIQYSFGLQQTAINPFIAFYMPNLKNFLCLILRVQ